MSTIDVFDSYHATGHAPVVDVERLTSGLRNAILRWHRVLDLALNVAVLAGLWLAYAAVRGVTADEMSTALANADRLMDVQRALRLPSELWLQEQALSSTWLIRAANRFYLYVHFPGTALFLMWTWARRRQLYSRVRNTLVVVTGAALVLHVLMPLAPPRMMAGFVDTGAVYGPSPYDLEAASAANQIAAMPSLHVGWALLVAVALVAGLADRWRWAAVAHPVITTVVVVVTANHYWADGIVAAVLVLAAWWATGRMAAKRSRAEASPDALVIDLRPLAAAPAIPMPAPVAASVARSGSEVRPCRRSVDRNFEPRRPADRTRAVTPLLVRPARGRPATWAGSAAASRAGRPPKEDRHDRPDTRDGLDHQLSELRVPGRRPSR